MNEEVQQLRRINNLLFNAFTLSSQIWMFKSRKEMIQFFCGIIFEDEACTAVVVSDRDGEYNQMDENVMNCKFLNYNPKRSITGIWQFFPFWERLRYTCF